LQNPRDFVTPANKLAPRPVQMNESLVLNAVNYDVYDTKCGEVGPTLVTEYPIVIEGSEPSIHGIKPFDRGPLSATYRHRTNNKN
jgi:hypothetical protein